ATGRGGAAATVDALATQAAVRALRGGADAVDAAVVAAAVLGVTEPYSCGIGGGGFMVLYRAGDRRVRTVDSREAAPDGFGPRSLLDPAGRPLPFAEAVTSGLSVGVPGTVRGWDEALRRFGTYDLARALRPAIRIARRGFAVDPTFAEQTRTNLERFAAFTSTRRLFLERDGTEPDPGDVLRNPDLARTYRRIARRGVQGFYTGSVARAIVDTVRRPPVVPGTTRTVRPGAMSTGDLADYDAQVRRPTRVGYRDVDVFGMAPPSSGGATVGEALNVLEAFDLRALGREPALHRFLEASRLAFADRNAYVGDPEYVDVPLAGLLSESFAGERRALIGERALPSPQRPGNPYDDQDDPSPSGPPVAGASLARSGSTTHLTVSDRRGNVVAYTFTIEQTGGSGIVVPGHGFLLNNELTDFEFTPPAPNAPEGGKRPRSSIAPTIVLRGGRPVLAVGSPGGATIITTVLQVLVERLDLGRSLPDAIAAPRASQRNGPTTQAEAAFIASPEGQALAARGHQFAATPEIGAATGIELLPDGRVVAAAEPQRRGGGAAAVERR
ncbi:MAG: gamma-glutamyltransferase, partial [Actinomycetota bacterium]|nr:gamma-glutamyltransferase [Actinomycetota bacterium]